MSMLLHILVLLYVAIAFLAFLLLSADYQEDVARLHSHYGHFPWVVAFGWWLLLVGISLCWPALLFAFVRIEDRL